MPKLITIEEANEIIAQHDDFLFCLRGSVEVPAGKAQDPK